MNISQLPVVKTTANHSCVIFTTVNCPFVLSFVTVYSHEKVSTYSDSHFFVSQQSINCQTHVNPLNPPQHSSRLTANAFCLQHAQAEADVCDCCLVTGTRLATPGVRGGGGMRGERERVRVRGEG